MYNSRKLAWLSACQTRPLVRRSSTTAMQRLMLFYARQQVLL